MQYGAAVTPARFWAATALFHLIVIVAAGLVARAWRDPARCRLPAARWIGTLARDAGRLAAIVAVASLMSTVAVNLSGLRRLALGDISSRLMGQALFAEGVLVVAALSMSHARASRPGRAVVFAAAAAGLFGVYVDAYRVEPNRLEVRRHFVDSRPQEEGATIRILHLTDIQTPAIGAHEERALAAGLSYHPQLIVLTGDYVQDALGRPTEDQAARDLRALIERIGFQAPLGVFATEGDVGPPCREVFAGTPVRCLADETARVTLPGGDTLAITGLSRARGRARNPARLAWLIESGPHADHRIVISHAPDFVDALPFPVDLVLAGHTHGGQVVVPFFGPPVTAMRLPRVYAGGLHDYRGIPLHVSRGVGMERGFSVPVRFLCPPEICVLDLRLSSTPTRRAGL